MEKDRGNGENDGPQGDQEGVFPRQESGVLARGAGRGRGGSGHRGKGSPASREAAAGRWEGGAGGADDPEGEGSRASGEARDDEADAPDSEKALTTATASFQ
jgi:hypothetical protein